MRRKDKNQEFIDKFQEYIDTNNTDAIMQDLPKLLKSYSKISTRMDRILKQSDTQQLEVLKLTENLEEKNTKINNLLNNAGQGFLYFDENMLIGPEYSKEVYLIFKEDITGKNITELLYPDDKEEALFIEATLKGILKDDPIKQEILISLLKKDFKINNKFIELEYKVLNDETFMLILTDVTAKKELDQKIKDKQQILKMVIEIVITKEQFLEVKKDYETFIEKIQEYKSLENLPNLRREIHTYKGLFAQKELLHTVKKLHEFESIIDSSLKKNILDETIINITKEDMYSWLELDLKIVKDILGNDYFSKSQYIEISKFRIDNIYDEVEKYLQTKEENLLYEIASNINDLKYKNIKIFFRPYEKLVQQLAIQLEKPINPLVLDIDNIYISDQYIPFINSLVHLFRNSADHGIESLEQRYENKKPEYGTIKCKVKKLFNTLKIEISDDGTGIDIEKIKSTAVKKGIYTQEEVNKLNENEALMIIFKDTFTTNEKVTTISGRGVGLASITSELEKLNGKMSIENVYKKGIKFVFELPFEQK